MLLSRVKYWKRWRLEEFPVQHDQESRTMSLLRGQVRSVPEILVFGEDSKIFHDRDSSSSYDNTTFLIKLLLHRVQESSIPKLECCEIQEKMCVWRNGEKWERRTIAINTYILLSDRKQDKSLDGEKRPMSMANHVVFTGTCNSRYDNSKLSLLGDASAKIPWPNNISELNREFF